MHKIATNHKKNLLVKKAYSKAELVKALADQTALAKNQVELVLNNLHLIIDAHLQQGAIGYFTLPGLLKIQAQPKPPSKPRQGVNPFTGEKTLFKGKPAHRGLKIKALKGLKDMLEAEAESC
jgi:nucleoid DNA-binding protein